MAPVTQLLEVTGLSKRFRGLKAVDDVSFSMAKGELFGIIGPNGAGKTTLFNLITGTLSPTAGEIRFRGDAITGLKPDAVARRGIVRTFQATTIFRDASVRDNVRRAYLLRTLHQPARLTVYRAELQAADAEAGEILELLELDRVSAQYARELPYGSQKLLGVAMALATRPRLLLMDEPAAGLNPSETRALAALFQRLRGRGIDIVLVEHDVRLVMSVCDRILVLNYGRAIALGRPDEIRTDPQVIEAYLGGADDIA
ncbi:MAG: ABC transporter ATP-binding protein [Alphaproteobacteria bacterium]|nr:MAG: ABC transporter ATP-binding protein [Alphaproteobacteria bacterium]